MHAGKVALGLLASRHVSEVLHRLAPQAVIGDGHPADAVGLHRHPCVAHMPALQVSQAPTYVTCSASQFWILVLPLQV